MVDRISPATTDADRESAAAMLGLGDEGLVVAEPFGQWVIEDDFASDRPRWELAGAIFTDDVRPYEEVKLRVLNCTHSLLAYLGALMGHETIAQAIADPVLRDASLRMITEDVLPTLTAPAGIDLTEYRDCHAGALRQSKPRPHHRASGDGRVSEAAAATLPHDRGPAVGGRCSAAPRVADGRVDHVHRHARTTSPIRWLIACAAPRRRRANCTHIRTPRCTRSSRLTTSCLRRSAIQRRFAPRSPRRLQRCAGSLNGPSSGACAACGRPVGCTSPRACRRPVALNDVDRSVRNRGAIR